MADSFCNKATESLICSNMLIYSRMKQDVFSDTKKRRNKIKRKTCGQVWCPILGNLCSAFNPPKCTHTVVNTHTPWTHTRSSGQPMLRHPGSSWGFGALLKGTSVVVLKVERAVGGLVPCSRTPRSWYWRWRERWLFTPPPTIPAGPETRTRDYRVTSLNIYPVGHDCR